MNKKGIARFLKYSSIGVSTFALDLCLLYLFAEGLDLNYVPATGLSFLIAVSINYFLSRAFVFPRTQRKVSHGYYGFLLIAGTGLALVTGLMVLMVEAFGWHYLPSRIIVAGLVGMGNYLLNLYVNFKVAGRH